MGPEMSQMQSNARPAATDAAEAPNDRLNAILHRLAAKAEACPSVAFKPGKGGGLKFEITYEGGNEGEAVALVLDAIGSDQAEFLDGLLLHMANATAMGGKIQPDAAAFMLSVVKGLEPRDQVEAMLASQIAAVHQQMMTFARRLNHVENIPQQDSAARAFNQLARTYAAQVEVLRKYRTGGQQNVTVKHVTVNEGGQAVVGDVHHGGRGA